MSLAIVEQCGSHERLLRIWQRLAQRKSEIDLVAVLDEIDRVLARRYGFTAEELDFISNYDIKYRLGRDSGDED